MRSGLQNPDSAPQNKLQHSLSQMAQLNLLLEYFLLKDTLIIL